MFLNRFFKIFSFVFVLTVSGILFLFPSVRTSIVLKSSDLLAIVDKAVSVPFVVVESKAKDLKNLSELNDENRSLKSRLYQKDIDQSKLNRLESENRELKDLMSIKNSVSGSNKSLVRLLTVIMVRGIRNLLLIKVVQMEFLILCLFFRLVASLVW